MLGHLLIQECHPTHHGLRFRYRGSTQSHSIVRSAEENVEPRSLALCINMRCPAIGFLSPARFEGHTPITSPSGSSSLSRPKLRDLEHVNLHEDLGKCRRHRSHVLT